MSNNGGCWTLRQRPDTFRFQVIALDYEVSTGRIAIGRSSVPDALNEDDNRDGRDKLGLDLERKLSFNWKLLQDFIRATGLPTCDSLLCMTAAEIIQLLNLRPHPEGGYFVETFRDAAGSGGRAASTAIYFLLARGERSHWHRIDAAEAWHYYAGAALRLEIAESDVGPVRRLLLGPDLAAGERPQAMVPPQAWQAAESLGDWTLVGCTVAPGFEFAGLEMAPTGWTPQP